MKKIFFLACALCSVLGAQATEISETEAARLASEFFANSDNGMTLTRGGSVKLTLAKSAKGYYAYNRGANSGFVVVAADDAMGGPILGYADHGTLDFDSMPANLKWWLSQYDRLATYTAAHPEAATTRTDAATRETVEPLVTSKWDQGSPYNDLCPELESGARGATGCVATAMAQVMYYNKWPKQGTGSVEYFWTFGKKTLSQDFSQSTYDWDSMTDTYDSNSSEASKQAVAVLMRDCGYAAHMQYDESSSSATVYEVASMSKYFNYDKAMRYVKRDFYSYDEWNTMLYEELAEKRPFLVNGGIHAFLFDGYQQKNGYDYFHVNWGWSGVSDGYFLCANLAPDEQGTGGGGDTYSPGLEAIIGLQKPVDGSTPSLEVGFLGNFMPEESHTRNQSIFYQGKVVNTSIDISDFYMGLKVCKQDGSGEPLYIKCSEKTSVSLESEDVQFFSEIQMSAFPKDDGTYVITPVCSKDNGEPWVDVRVSKRYVQNMILTVKGDSLIFTQGNKVKLPVVTDLKVTDDKVYAGYTFQSQATITAKDNDYCGNIYLVTTQTVDDELPAYTLDYAAAVDLRKGEDTTITLKGIAPTSGDTFVAWIVDADKNVIGSLKDIPLTAVPQGTLELVATNLETQTSDVDPMQPITIKFDVECKSGFYKGRMGAIFSEGTEDKAQLLASNELLIFEGDKQSFELNGIVDKLEYGKTYNVVIMVEGVGPDDDGFAICDPFTITTAQSSGIGSVTAAGEPQSIKIYTLNGKLVSTQTAKEANMTGLPAGAYIVKTGDKAKKVIRR